jgi:hypothetical protein
MNDIAGIGHNKPPVKEQMEQKYPEVFRRLDEVEALAALIPEKIVNDDEAGKVQDMIKAMRVAINQADGARKVEKEDYDAIVKQINATFKIPMERVNSAMATARARLDVYLEEKAAAERRRREEEAERLRLAAEEKQREAAAAEARAREAEQRRIEEERKAREAEEARAKAVKDREEAEARAAQAKADEARLKAQRLAEAAEAAKRKEQDEAEAAARAIRIAEQKKLEEEAKQRRIAEEAAALAAKGVADAERAKQRDAEDAARAAKREERAEGRAADAALDSAVREERRADRMDGAAQAGDAEMSRTRGELGTVGSLAQRWTYTVVAPDKINLDMLRGYISADAIEAAVGRWMAANRNRLTDGATNLLPGVRFDIAKEARVV